jgi:hypothetical protein
MVYAVADSEFRKTSRLAYQRNPMTKRRRTRDPAQLEQLEEDLRQIAALVRGGRSPEDALLEFRRRLDHDHIRDIFAAIAMHRFIGWITPEGGALLPSSIARAFDFAHCA